VIAQKTYAATAIGGSGTMTFARGAVTGPGASAVPLSEQYLRFAGEVTGLEAMEAQGLLKIDFVHRESTTGSRYVDIVRFTRIK
jgi:hypothetical protein